MTVQKERDGKREKRTVGCQVRYGSKRFLRKLSPLMVVRSGTYVSAGVAASTSCPSPAACASIVWFTTEAQETERRQRQRQWKNQGNKESQTSTPAASSSQGFRNFQALFKQGWSARQQFLKDTCWKFQSNVCQDQDCPGKHACVGCGKDNISYDSCGCMEARIPRA